jgi:hypothetical protein
MHSPLSKIASVIVLSISISGSSAANNTIIDCLTLNNVPYAVKGSANWTALVTPYNLRLKYIPAVITIPETPGQVSKSVTCAAAYNLKVQPKGGGHSYASYSSGGQDGSLIVNMEKFSGIIVNQSALKPLNMHDALSEHW